MNGRLIAVVMVLVSAGVRGQRMSGRPSDSYEDHYNEFLNQCKANGGDQAQQDFEMALHEIPQCQSIADVNQKFHHVLRTGRLETLISEYCLRKDGLMECFNPIISAMKQCEKKENKQRLDTAFKVLETAIDFVCNNKDDIAAVYNSPQEMICLRSWSLSGDLVKCADKALRLRKSYPYFMFSGNPKDCKQLWELKQCVLESFGECNDLIFAKLLKSFLEEILEVTSCGQKLKFNSGHMLLPNSQHITLLTILTAVLIALSF